MAAEAEFYAQRRAGGHQFTTCVSLSHSVYQAARTKSTQKGDAILAVRPSWIVPPVCIALRLSVRPTQPSSVLTSGTEQVSTYQYKKLLPRTKWKLQRQIYCKYAPFNSDKQLLEQIIRQM